MPVLCLILWLHLSPLIFLSVYNSNVAIDSIHLAIIDCLSDCKGPMTWCFVWYNANTDNWWIYARLTEQLKPKHRKCCKRLDKISKQVDPGSVRRPLTYGSWKKLRYLDNNVCGKRSFQLIPPCIFKIGRFISEYGKSTKHHSRRGPEWSGLDLVVRGKWVLHQGQLLPRLLNLNIEFYH